MVSARKTESNSAFVSQKKENVQTAKAGHNLKAVDKKEASCTEAGYEAYWECQTCGKLFSDATGTTEINSPVEIKGSGHNLKAVDKKEASCTEAGYEAYWECQTCEKLFSDATGTTEISSPVEIKVSGHSLKKTDGVAATAAKEGNSTYWHCDDCDKYFSDEKAQNEIKKEDTVLAKIAPVIIKGDGATVTVGEKKALSFTSDAAYNDFIRVEVDGKTVDESNYTVKSGSTIVTLKEAYVASLLEGEHTLGIVSESGTATAHFTVNKKTASTETSPTQMSSTTKTSTSTGTTTKSSPQTGDNSEMQLYVILMLASMCVLGGVCMKRKHKSWK